MTDAKLQYSIKVPSGYLTVISKGKQYLDEHRDLVPRKSLASPIFISDVFQYALDLLADHLEIKFKNDGDLEFVEPSNMFKKTPAERLLDRYETDRAFRAREYKLGMKLTPEMWKEYTEDYLVKGIPVEEYLLAKKSGK